MEDLTNKIVSAVIVTCANLDYSLRCLESIRRQSYKNLEVSVINNTRNHEFEKNISEAYPEVSLYRNFCDSYYCQALNLGIGRSRGEFILCLNDDVVLDEEFIKNALRGFSVNDKIGIVSGKILRGDRLTIDSAGLFLSCWRTAKERGYGLKDKFRFSKEEYIFGVNGAVAFYRKKMLDEISEGGEYFDSDFRMFYEDLDISWRAQNSGWRGYYIPSAVAYHIRGGTARSQGGVDKPYARRYLRDDLHVDLIKNRYFTIIKNESFPGFLAYLPCMLLYDLIMWGYILFFRPRLIKRFLVVLKNKIRPILRKRKSQALKPLKQCP